MTYLIYKPNITINTFPKVNERKKNVSLIGNVQTRQYVSKDYAKTTNIVLPRFCIQVEMTFQNIDSTSAKLLRAFNIQNQVFYLPLHSDIAGQNIEQQPTDLNALIVSSGPRFVSLINGVMKIAGVELSDIKVANFLSLHNIRGWRFAHKIISIEAFERGANNEGIVSIRVANPRYDFYAVNTKINLVSPSAPFTWATNNEMKISLDTSGYYATDFKAYSCPEPILEGVAQ